MGHVVRVLSNLAIGCQQHVVLAGLLGGQGLEIPASLVDKGLEGGQSEVKILFCLPLYVFLCLSLQFDNLWPCLQFAEVKTRLRREGKEKEKCRAMFLPGMLIGQGGRGWVRNGSQSGCVINLPQIVFLATTGLAP